MVGILNHFATSYIEFILGQQVLHDDVVGQVGLVPAAELELLGLKAYGADDQLVGDQEAPLDKKTLVVLAAHGGDAAVRDADHRLPALEELLVVEDEALIGEAQEAGAAAFKVKDGPDNLIRQADVLNLLQLVFLIRY